MALNPSIILAGQQADIIGSFDRGQQAGARQSQIQEQNALRDLYKTQGAGILSGEQGALNALAGINAPLAMDFRNSQQTLQINAQNAQLRAAELARTLDADQRAKASDMFGMGASMLTQAQTPEQFQAIVSRPGFAESAGVLGIAPEMLTFENRDMIVASALGAKDALAMGGGGDPMTLVGKINADLRAGRISPEDAQLELERAAPRGMTIESTPGGGFRFVQGAGVGASDRDGGPADVTSAIAMINSIDGILNDPALENSTGVMAPLQSIPGTPMRRFGARADQLNGQAFLQAFESLKGGGQITEIEGLKATQAIGRLDTSQSAKDYRNALTELRSILAVAAERPQGWANQQRQITQAQEVIAPDAITQMSPEEIRSLGPDAFTRIPISQLKGLTPEQWDAIEEIAEGAQ